MPRGLVLVLAAALAPRGRGAAPDVFNPGADVVFGQSAAFEGPTAALGLRLRLGIKAAFTEYNTKRPFGAPSVGLLSYDDGYEPGPSVNNTLRLISDDNVFALIGEVGTPTSQVSYPVAVKSRVPYIGTLSGAMFLRQPYERYIVNYRASYIDETASIVRMFVDVMYLSRLSILYQNDSFGETGRTGMDLALRTRRLVIHSEGWYERNTVDISSNGISRLTQSSAPEAIIMIGTADPLAAFVVEAKKIWPKIFFATVSLPGGTFAQKLGSPDMRANVFMTQAAPLPTGVSVPLVLDYQAALQSLDPNVTATFDAISLEGYIIGRMSAEVVARAASMGNLTRESFLDVIYDNAVIDVGRLRLGPFGGNCTEEGAGCQCNQGQHQVYGSSILPDGTFGRHEDLDFTFATCGYEPQNRYVIQLGQTADFSGSMTSANKALRDGLLMAFEDAAKTNFLGSFQVELISLDDGGDPGRAIANVRKLIDQYHVLAIVGSVGSKVAEAVLPDVTDRGVPFIGQADGDSFLHYPFNKDVVNIRVSHVDEIAAIVDYYVNQRSLEKIAVFTESGAQGIDVIDGVRIALASNGFLPFGLAEYNSTLHDIEAGFNTLRSHGTPEVVVMFGDPESLAEFVQLSGVAWPECHFAATSDVLARGMSKLLQAASTNNLLISTVVPLPGDNSSEIAQSFARLSQSSVSVLDWDKTLMSLEGFTVATFVLTMLKTLGVFARLELIEQLYLRGTIMVKDMSVGPFMYPDETQAGCNSGGGAVFLTQVLRNGTLAYADGEYRLDVSTICDLHDPPCVSNYYRSSPEAVCEFCSSGNYVHSSACLPCPSGYFCEKSSQEPRQCPLGFGCPVGSIQPCPANLMDFSADICRGTQESNPEVLSPWLIAIIVVLSSFALCATVFGTHRWRRYLIKITEDKFARVMDLEDDVEAQRAVKTLRNLGCMPSAVDHLKKGTRARLSSERGVSLNFLLSDEFLKLTQEKSGMEDPSFYDLQMPFFFGESAIGADLICPRDGKPGVALVDWLPKVHRGRCTHFLSWTWGYKVSLVRGALQHWKEILLEFEELSEVNLYMCFFVNNQYRILVSKEKTGAEDLQRVFEANLSRIGNVIAVLDTWDNPAYLTRIWTIFEQATAIRLKVPVTMVLPLDAAKSLLQQIELGASGISRVKSSLTTVDSHVARASFIEDEVAIKNIILQSYGFAEIDRNIMNFMINWVCSEIEMHIRHLVHARGKPGIKRAGTILAQASRLLDEEHDAKGPIDV